MTELVTLIQQEPRTDTLVIARETKVAHKAVIQLVRNYISDLEEFGVVAFQIANSAFEMANSKRSNQGRPTEYATLNEPQSMLIMTYMKNTAIVRDFKKRLIREFMRMKQALLNKFNLSWQQMRLDGKAARKSETDTIKVFVQYAIAQGSQNASMYYSRITSMTNKALFFVASASPKPFRDLLDSMQLNFLTTAENVIEVALQEGMRRSLHYKEIYQLCRDRVVSLAAQLPQQRRVVLTLP